MASVGIHFAAVEIPKKSRELFEIESKGEDSKHGEGIVAKASGRIP